MEMFSPYSFNTVKKKLKRQSKEEGGRVKGKDGRLDPKEKQKHLQLIMGIFLPHGNISFMTLAEFFIPPPLSLPPSPHPHSTLPHSSITPLQTGLSLWGALSFPLGWPGSFQGTLMDANAGLFQIVLQPEPLICQQASLHGLPVLRKCKSLPYRHLWKNTAERGTEKKLL